MKRYLGLDGVQMSATDVILWCLKVAAVVVFAVSMMALCSLLSVSRVMGQSLEPLVLFQLGACTQQPGDRPACVTLGSPTPEVICVAMKRRLIAEGFPGRPVCARVLVDATDR